MTYASLIAGRAGSMEHAGLTGLIGLAPLLLTITAPILGITAAMQPPIRPIGPMCTWQLRLSLLLHLRQPIARHLSSQLPQAMPPLPLRPGQPLQRARMDPVRRSLRRQPSHSRCFRAAPCQSSQARPYRCLQLDPRANGALAPPPNFHSPTYYRRARHARRCRDLRARIPGRRASQRSAR
jgi:hypothetical protein